MQILKASHTAVCGAPVLLFYREAALSRRRELSVISLQLMCVHVQLLQNPSLSEEPSTL